jgi:hypothetical protein
VLVYFHWKVEPQVGHEKKARLEGSRESARDCDAARKGLGLEGEEGRGSDAGAGGRRQNEDKKERDNPREASREERLRKGNQGVPSLSALVD